MQALQKELVSLQLEPGGLRLWQMLSTPSTRMWGGCRAYSQSCLQETGVWHGLLPLRLLQTRSEGFRACLHAYLTKAA